MLIGFRISSAQEDQYAPILVKALEDGKQSVPVELKAMANQFVEKVGNELVKGLIAC